MSLPHARHIFGLSEWESWLDRMTTSLFDMPGPDFERAYLEGKIEDSCNVRNVASVLPLIRRLRDRTRLQ
jgi:hypothetical protein